jgi:hypothetical protein
MLHCNIRFLPQQQELPALLHITRIQEKLNTAGQWMNPDTTEHIQVITWESRPATGRTASG